MLFLIDTASRIMATPLSQRRKLSLLRATLLLGAASYFRKARSASAADELDGEMVEEAMPGTTGETGQILLRGRFLEKVVTYELKGGLAFVEGDIVIGTDDDMKSEIRAVGIAREGNRWPLGVVPFEVDPAIASIVQAATADWQRDTPIRFVQRTRANAGQHPNFVEFVAGVADSGCYAHVGLQGGRQVVNLEVGRCGTGAARHEIGHAVGLWHEQSREDRDRWVTIFWDNIEEGKEHNFDQHIDDGDDIGPYDWDSIMHYASTAFGIVDPATGSPKVTVDTIPPGAATIGARTQLSDGDKRAIRYLYPLAGPWTWSADRRIPEQATKSAPALATLASRLHLVHLGESSNDIWHSQSDNGADWTDNIKVSGQKSKASPALCTFGRELHMVHLGDESNDIWHTRSTGESWTENVKLSDKKSRATPALIEFKGVLHMVHIGDESSNLWYSRSEDGEGWSVDSRIANKQSRTTPALAVFNNELHMVHIGESSENIYHSWSTDGRTWSEEMPIRGQQSRAAPALAVVHGELHMVHIGESSNDLWYSRTDDGRTWTENARLPDKASQTMVALAVLDRRIHMVHKGEASENLWRSDLTLAI